MSKLTFIRLALTAGLIVSMHGVLAAQRKFTPISIPMRDGKSLAADLYATDTTVRKPTILIQTPYNKMLYRLGSSIPQAAGGMSFPSDTLHYNYVVVDWRGFYASTGAAEPGYDRGLDGYDCVEWIASRPWSDGAIGTWGPSALGAIQYMTARHQPPHLVCAVPLVQDFRNQYSDSYYGGVLRKEMVESLDSLGFTSTQLVTAHPTHDASWRLVEAASDYADSIAVPMLLIGGWYDHDPDGVIRAFADLRAQSPAAVRSRHRLIMGPWIHSGVGKTTQGELEYPDVDTIAGRAALAFFDRYLRGVQNGIELAPPVSYYQMGENAWHAAEHWSDVAVGRDTLYLASNLELRQTPQAEASYAALPFDPRNPSPAVGGSRFNPFDPSVTVGPYDQRALVESRQDVLVCSTPPLERDLVVDGLVSAELHISSDRTDTDIAVRLCDVYPDGRSMIVTQGIHRLRFRNGVDPGDTSQITPGTVYPVTVELQNLGLTFLKGHRLRIDVSSSIYPHFDVNPNSGGPLYQPGDTLVAANRVYFGGAYPSRVILPVGAMSPAAVERPVAATESRLRLDPPAPNPGAGPMRLGVHLPEAADLSVTVESLLGEKVVEVFDGFAEAGERAFTLDTGRLPAGTYLCRARSGGIESVQLLTVVR